MSTNKNITICGCGGIGSYLAQHVDRLLELKQINKTSKYTFFDDDIVEHKNILYQNFEESDINDKKTTALSFKFFNISFKTKRLTYEDLTASNLIVLCADNNIIRREAYNNWKTNGIPFIDARANGRAIGIFSSDTNDYLNTIDNSSESSSCQNPFQLINKEIEYGNVIIAAYLAQCLLNFERKQKLPNNFMVNI